MTPEPKRAFVPYISDDSKELVRQLHALVGKVVAAVEAISTDGFLLRFEDGTTLKAAWRPLDGWVELDGQELKTFPLTPQKPAASEGGEVQP